MLDEISTCASWSRLALCGLAVSGGELIAAVQCGSNVSTPRPSRKEGKREPSALPLLVTSLGRDFRTRRVHAASGTSAAGPFPKRSDCCAQKSRAGKGYVVRKYKVRSSRGEDAYYTNPGSSAMLRLIVSSSPVFQESRCVNLP